MNLRRLGFLCWGLSGLAYAEVLDAIPKFTVNQRLQVEITRSREDSSFKLSNGSNNTSVSIEVKAQSAEGTTLDWVIVKSTLENPEQLKDPLIAAGARVLNGLPITLRLSPRGELRELLNLDSTRAQFQKQAKALIESMAAQIDNAAKKKEFLEIAPKAISFDAALQPVVQDWKIWTTFAGFAFDTEKPIKGKAVGPHPVDVGKIASELELSVKLAAAQKELTMTGRQLYDPNGFAGLTRSILQQSQVAYRVEGKSPEVQMTDEYNFIFDTDHGWAKKASRARHIIIEPLLTRTDTTTIVIKSVQ